MSRIDEIREREAKATAGPWEYKDNGFDGGVYYGSTMIVGGEPCEGRIEPDDPNADFIAHSRDDITFLLSEVDRLQADVERLKESQRWIPVTERLPETDDPVLAYAYTDEIIEGTYTKEKGWFLYNEVDPKIIKWMPIPPDEPPKGEE